MNRRTLGILTTMVGAVLGAWWWTERRAMASRRPIVRDRGRVIFDNTPTANTTPEPVM